MMGNRPVAVIDIGSNSIKLLVASGPGLQVLQEITEETRISTGIGKGNLRLDPAAIKAGVESVERLYHAAARFRPKHFAIIATSAVRDAENRAEFLDPIERITGIRPVTLSGDEEAQYIGLGVASDPHIDATKPFYLLDLGGGSLELLEFNEGRVLQKTSLQLGAVRLKEKLLKNPAAPMTKDEIVEVAEYVSEAVAVSNFSFRNPGALVGTGGAMTVTRIVLAKQRGLSLRDSPPSMELQEMRQLFEELASMSLQERSELRSLPAARADIMPVALLTLTTLMELAAASSIVHSFYNLRFGLAAELLSKGVDDALDISR